MVFVSMVGLPLPVLAARDPHRPPAKVTILAVIRSSSRHVDGSDVEYQGTITAFSEFSSL
jgi:hypothetical protein